MSGYALELDLGSAAAWMGRAEGGVSLRVKRGEIHAVLTNSADETAALTEILTGQRRHVQGEFRVDGNEAKIRSPRDALMLGIGAVYRQDGLADALTLLDHYRLAPGVPRGKKQARAAAEAAAEKYGLKVEWTIPAAELSAVERFRGELLCALAEDIDILILEEPADRLPPLEMEKLLPLLRRFTEENKTVLLITRRMETAKTASACTDLTGSRGTDEGTLPPLEKRKIAAGSVALEARHLTLEKWGLEEPILRAVSLEARAGEVTAVLGLPGSGLEALAAVLAGLEKASGRLRLNGKEITTMTAKERLRAGIALAPGPDMGYGLAGKATLPENMALHHYRSAAFQESGFLKKGEMRAYADQALERQGTDPKGDASAAGNSTRAEKQRFVLARETEENPEVLIALKPTEGLNRAEARDIHNRLLTVRNNRRSVLLLTEDLREAMTVGDRILVLCQGAVTGEFEPSWTTERELGLYMAGDRQQGREEPFDEEE